MRASKIRRCCYTPATGLSNGFSSIQESGKKGKGSSRVVNDDVRDEGFEQVPESSKAF